MRIYAIFDKLDERVVYIGKTIDDTDFYPHGKHIRKIFMKNRDRYEYQIIEEINNADLLCEREIHYISHYNTYNDKTCFNFTKGGTGGNTICKLTPCERQIIKAKELLTKKLNPEIMKNAAYKARETFLKRPIEEQQAITEQRIQKSIQAKIANALKMSDEEKKMRSLRHSNVVKHVHLTRTSEQKQLIHNKISNTLKGNNITLRNIKTSELLALSFSEWKKIHKVDVYHLDKGLQKTSHGWKLP
jgi:hypothetical protein